MSSTTEHQDTKIIVATYGNNPDTLGTLISSLSKRGSNWRPVYLPLNPSGAHMGETLMLHGIKRVAIYLDDPQRLVTMQHEIRLLRRLLPNRAKIMVGGAIHDSIDKFCADIAVSAHDNLDDFLSSVDLQLDHQSFSEDSLL